MTTLIRYPLSHSSLRLFSDLDAMANTWFSPAWEKGVRRLALDIREDEAAYQVYAELPGIDKETLEITIDDGVLRISAESQKDGVSADNGPFVRLERQFGRFVRELRLGAGIDEQAIGAEYRDGVLALTVPKVPVALAKKVNVKMH